MDEFEYEVTACEAHTETNVFSPKNPLNRPKISYRKPILALFGFVVTLALLNILTRIIEKTYLDNISWIGVLSNFVLVTVWLCCIGKKVVIWFVHLYQHYAPDRVRLRCLFEPSCSEYMILAVNKYGVFRGVYKGVKRLLRCRPPGGIDYP